MLFLTWIDFAYSLAPTPKDFWRPTDAGSAMCKPAPLAVGPFDDRSNPCPAAAN